MKSIMKTLIVFFLSSIALRADVHTDLQNLFVQGSVLNSELAAFTFYQDGACMKMGTLNRSIEAYTQNIANISETMPAFSVSDADLNGLSELSYLIYNMSIESVRLSMELTQITNSAELFEYAAGLSAMLQLSQDIGTMADRILEMADRILVMADNIGLIADRIVATQIIQNQNIALTQSSILSTQQNMVLLSDSLSTITYNLTLGQILNDANALSDAMNALNLNSDNMQVELSSLQMQSLALLNRTTTLLDMFVGNSAKMSHYINSDTLSMLGDLSVIYSTFGTSLQMYANTIEQIAPLTDTLILSDATASMLQLSKDIGVMSDRIMEMTDKIFVMADNIGLMADRIVLTQNIQMGNVALTQASLATTQSIMLTVIKNFGL